MYILRSIELDTTTQMSSNRNNLQQMQKERTLCESLQKIIHKQPNSEKTNRRRTRRPKRNIKRIERQYPPLKVNREN